MQGYVIVLPRDRSESSQKDQNAHVLSAGAVQSRNDKMMRMVLLIIFAIYTYIFNHTS